MWEKVGKGRKIAILILKKLTFEGFREFLGDFWDFAALCIDRSPDWKTADEAEEAEEAEEDEDMYEGDFVHSFISHINAI